MSIRNRLTKLEVAAGPDPREVERQRRRAAKRARAWREAAVDLVLSEAPGASKGGILLPGVAICGLLAIEDGSYFNRKGVYHPLAVYVHWLLWCASHVELMPMPRLMIEYLLAPPVPFWGCGNGLPAAGERHLEDWRYGCLKCHRIVPSVVTVGGSVEYPLGPSCPWCGSTSLGDGWRLV